MKERIMLFLKKITPFLAMLFIAIQANSTTAYPEKPIKIVIGFPAGGPLDQHARLLVDKLQTIMGQPILVTTNPVLVAALAQKVWPNRLLTDTL